MNSAADNNNCVHCGADCGKTPVIWDDRKFCCNGCQTVYQMLHENKLYTYYNLESAPGIRIETTEFGNKYEFLDNEEVAAKLITFSEGEISKVRFYIPVIHCASCIWLLEHLTKLNPGIKYSSVNFVKKEVDITFNRHEFSLRQLVELLGSIHYIPDLSLSQAGNKPETHSYKKLLYKIGVAGFVFMNVMTYSLPHYFHGKPMDDRLSHVLAVLSYILTLPVVFYSGNDYLISAYKNLRKKTTSIDLPIAIGILALFFVTSYDVLTGSGAGYSDSLAGLIFFLLAGKWYQGKSYEALSFERNYKSYFPIAVTRINQQLEEKTGLDKEESILLEKIQPGDVLLIRNRELIPADSVLLEGAGLIDYSFVTGESSPAVKKQGDFLYAGGRQMGGIITIRVEKDIDQSHLTHLWNQDKTYHKPTDKLKNLTDRISKYFTLVIIAIAMAGFAGWMIYGDLHKALFVFTSVLIIACPCALALSVPFTFGNTMRIFGRSGLYIKSTDVIEKLAHINAIVFDKTGTLTRPNEHTIRYTGRELSAAEQSALLSMTRQSPHPLSMALAQWFQESNYIDPEHFVEIHGRGVFGNVAGIDVKYGSAEYVTQEQSDQEHIASAVYVAFNGNPAGYFTISNHYRDGLEEVINRLKAQFDLHLLTGDNAAELDNLSRYFESGKMLFNQKPQEKAAYIEQLHEQGKIVLMTGDGLNDAGALMQSDVALTIANKAYQFSPASDAVLEAGKFPKLARFIGFTRISVWIVYLSFLISFLYNVVGISIALAGYMSPVIAAILMPISSVSVVAFATFVTRAAGSVYLSGDKSRS
jgi:P-type Cu+ transporter